MLDEIRGLGFSLVELLVSIALFGLITTGILLVYSRVGEQIFTTTLAYDIALAFREAQHYGVSVKGFGQGSDLSRFDVSYGLHFQSGASGDDALFVLFVDQRDPLDGKKNQKYDGAHSASGCSASQPNECVKVFRLEHGNTISKFCGVLPTEDAGRDAADANKHEECNNNSTPPTNPPPLITRLDVLFERPNPDAIIRTDLSGQTERYKAARVYIKSPRGEKRVIEVISTGQISLK